MYVCPFSTVSQQQIIQTCCDFRCCSRRRGAGAVGVCVHSHGRASAPAGRLNGRGLCLLDSQPAGQRNDRRARQRAKGALSQGAPTLNCLSLLSVGLYRWVVSVCPTRSVLSKDTISRSMGDFSSIGLQAGQRRGVPDSVQRHFRWLLHYVHLYNTLLSVLRPAGAVWLQAGQRRSHVGSELAVLPVENKQP